MQRKSPPTLLDVAERAGVHKNTVSVALNGRKAETRISDETRQRILAAAKELGYRPNAIASSLRRRCTNTIGFYQYGEYGPLHAYTPFTAAVITGMNAECRKHKKDVLIHSGFERNSVEDIYLDLTSGKVDGVVVMAISDTELVERLAGSHLPVVAIADPTPALPCVTVDDAEGSRLLADHLAAKGHRHILYRNAPDAFPSPQRRLAAFRQRAAEHGMVVTLSNPTSLLPDLEEHEIALLSGYSNTRPTAAVAWCDLYASDIIGYCRKAGLRIPDDLAVAGFDGAKHVFEPAHHLTTIHAPWTDVARTAVALIMDMLDGQEVTGETMLPVSLVVGDTT